jgi:NADPH-dependent 2,4-dienoyl-CoA reductase/sulfur reductase-like enzyme
MATPDNVVVVGASLAGLRAVETLRQDGYAGRIVLVGAEAHLPYDRPPLSKQLLAGTAEVDQVMLRPTGEYESLDLDLRLNTMATALDPAARQVELGGNERIGYDALLIATGAIPRLLPGTPPLKGIHVLRTLDDCLALRADIERAEASGGRVVVVGAGFIGAEVAATCHGRGVAVTVLEALPVPMVNALGLEMGSACAALHYDHGVDLRCGVAVSSFLGEKRVTGVMLNDGRRIDADVVVVGVGVTPATAWLESSGLRLDNGVVCDATSATEAPGVFAAGDVARWHNPLFGRDMRVEHWTNAADQGMVAAKNILAGDGAAEPYAPVPYFWSDQYETKIQCVGHPGPGDEMQIVDGSVEDRRFVAIYGRAGRLVGALAFSRPRLLMNCRRMISEGAPWEEALAQHGGTAP